MNFARVTERFFSLAAWSAALLTSTILVLFLYLGLPLLENGGLETILSAPWQPEQGLYGIRSMLETTLLLALTSLVISVPVSLGCAFLITTLAPVRLRRILLVITRYMSGIPTVVYGFVALFVLVPMMRTVGDGGSGLSILTVALVLGLLVAPTMIIFFTAAMQRVPAGFLLAADALGASPVQKLLYIIVPQAWPGLLSGILLGLGRALGDTMISLMLAGNAVAEPESILDSARTLTAHIGLVMATDVDSMQFKSIFVCGIVLYVMTTILVLLLRFLDTKKIV